MKNLKRFFRRNRDRIISVSTLGLFGIILALTIAYLMSDTMNPGTIFIFGALFMIALALNYRKQAKKNIAVYVFYGVTTIACIIFGVYLFLNPIV